MHVIKKFICLVFLTISSTIDITARTVPIIFPRSQSVNAARELVGWQQFINRAEQECTYGAFSLIGEYGESFSTARLLSCLFDGDVTFTNVNGATSNDVIGSCFSGCYKVAQLHIQGSCITGRNPKAWLADYFGLPTDFVSIITFKPRIQTALGEVNFYVGLDEWAQGVYFRIHAPIVWTKWNLCALENIINPGSNTFQQGYMSAANTSTILPAPTSDGILNTQLRHSFLAATDGTYTFGDMQSALKFGKFTDSNIISARGEDDCNNYNSNNSLVRLSDVEMALGYNFLLCDDYHLGLQIRGSVPAGNKPRSEYVFEPIVGNGKFGTLGFGLTGHAALWRDNDCPDRSFNFYIDANITHLFKNCQLRSFDLDGKPNSRYMLIEQMNNSAVSLYANEDPGNVADGVAPAAQYAGALLPLINKSTFDVDVSFAAQGDVALKFSYTSCRLEVDLGYEFWGRSKEKVLLRHTIFPESTYALKGDAYIYGFSAGAVPPLVIGDPVHLSATESAATIHSGTNFGITGFDCSSTAFADGTQRANPNVDSAEYARSQADATVGANLNTDTTAGAPQTRTSAEPIFISQADLSVTCGERVITHKLFGNLSYSLECKGWTPFVGIGGEVEFAPCSSRCVAGRLRSKNNGAISQWGVWLKTGVGF